MNQVSVSRVNLYDTEACFAGTTRRGGKGRNDVLNAVDRGRLRHWIVIGERQRARGNDIVPPSITFGDGSLTCPWAVGPGLPTGISQLHPSTASLPRSKPDASHQRPNMILHPH